MLEVWRGEASTGFLPAGRGRQGRHGACKECFKAAERAVYAKDPEVQERRRQILERWRE